MRIIIFIAVVFSLFACKTIKKTSSQKATTEASSTKAEMWAIQKTETIDSSATAHTDTATISMVTQLRPSDTATRNQFLKVGPLSVNLRIAPNASTGIFDLSVTARKDSESVKLPTTKTVSVSTISRENQQNNSIKTKNITVKKTEICSYIKAGLFIVFVGILIYIIYHELTRKQ